MVRFDDSGTVTTDQAAIQRRISHWVLFVTDLAKQSLQYSEVNATN